MSVSTQAQVTYKSAGNIYFDLDKGSERDSKNEITSETRRNFVAAKYIGEDVGILTRHSLSCIHVTLDRTRMYRYHILRFVYVGLLCPMQYCYSRMRLSSG